MERESYQEWGQRIRELGVADRELSKVSSRLGLPDVTATEWHANLVHKLIPQVEVEPYIVVAVAGGTNVGKSTIFNHLVGYRASRVHHNASQTKHPVCTIPRGFLARHDLSEIFRDFQLRPWASDEDALRDGPDNLLIYREDPVGDQPSRLLLLDTPDIDGSLTVNWERARLIRHASDVLVCILTAEKYNDEAVRRFFHEAADSDKTALVVFNMVDWPEDHDYCLGWLDTFRRGTGIDPGHAYAVPRRRKAAEDLELPFHGLSAGSTDPRRDLGELHFAQIKIRSLTGALRVVLDDRSGLPAFLRQIHARAQEYQTAKDAIQQGGRVAVVPPVLPSHVVMDEVWKWLAPRRTAFDRTIHWAYGSLSNLVTRRFYSGPTSLEAEFVRQEFDALAKALDETFGRLELIHKGGNALVREELAEILRGDARAEAFESLRRAHEALPLVSQTYRDSIVETLDSFERANLGLVRAIQVGLFATAVIRPVITVAMFGAGDLAAHTALGLGTGVAQQAAVHSTAQIATELVSGAVVSVGAEGAIAGAATPVQGLVARLFAQFYQERADLLAQVIHDSVVGRHLQRIGDLAQVESLPCYRNAARLVRELAGTASPPARNTVASDAEAPIAASI